MLIISKISFIDHFTCSKDVQTFTKAIFIIQM